MTNTNEAANKCQYCLKNFTDTRNRNRHIMNVHSGLPNKCDHCSKTVDDLKTHILSMHSDRIIKCIKCDRLFGNTSIMNQHIKYVHNILATKCTKCQKSFKDLDGHTLSVHKTKNTKVYYVWQVFWYSIKIKTAFNSTL